MSGGKTAFWVGCGLARALPVGGRSLRDRPEVSTRARGERRNRPLPIHPGETALRVR